MYVVGLSGTQGTGKSTIIQGVKETGQAVVQTQLSREAQVALGWDKLSYAQESPQNMWALQTAVMNAMIARDEQIVKSETLTLVERTPADMWAYTKLWCDRLGIDSECDLAAVAYRRRCFEMMSNYCMVIIVPESDEVAFVEEANRADLESRSSVASSINEFLFGSKVPHPIIQRRTKKGRIVEVETWMITTKIKKDL